MALGEIVWLFKIYPILAQGWTQIIQSQCVFLVLKENKQFVVTVKLKIQFVS